jgi:hypothetical protein
LRFRTTFFGTAVLGASAGVFGLVAAFATSAPDQPITLLIFFVLPVTFKAKVLLIIEGCIALAGFGTAAAPSLFRQQHRPRSAFGRDVDGHRVDRWGMMPPSRFNFWRPFLAAGSPAGIRPAPAPKRAPKSASRKTEELPPAEFISREVDPILEKISAHGIHSLTERERQILEAARSKMAKR